MKLKKNHKIQVLLLFNENFKKNDVDPRFFDNVALRHSYGFFSYGLREKARELFPK